MKKSQKLKAKGFAPSLSSGQKLRRQGFSLIEVLFTLMILSVGVSAVAVLMTGSIKNSTNAKNQIIASELAQEGIELVENLKRNNPSFKSDGADIHSGSNYRVDFYSDYNSDFKGSDIADDAQKQLKIAGGFYSHAGTTSTKFYRKIQIANNIDGNAAVTVTSYVTWNGTGFSAISPLSTACNVANKCVSVVAVLPDLN